MNVILWAPINFGILSNEQFLLGKMFLSGGKVNKSLRHQSWQNWISIEGEIFKFMLDMTCEIPKNYREKMEEGITITPLPTLK